jgi:beta-aspartyl-peptidase (threonine type)
MFRPALVIHGGAGRSSPDLEAERRTGCRAALDAGWRILSSGGGALDAVCAAAVELENCPAFNAGRGSGLTAAGTIEMDASVMEGTHLRAGATAVVRTVRNPIRLARAISMRERQFSSPAPEPKNLHARTPSRCVHRKIW